MLSGRCWKSASPRHCAAWHRSRWYTTEWRHTKTAPSAARMSHNNTPIPVSVIHQLLPRELLAASLSRNGPHKTVGLGRLIPPNSATSTPRLSLQSFRLLSPDSTVQISWAVLEAAVPLCTLFLVTPPVRCEREEVCSSHGADTTPTARPASPYAAWVPRNPPRCAPGPRGA